MHRYADRLTDRQTDRLTDRQTDRLDSLLNKSVDSSRLIDSKGQLGVGWAGLGWLGWLSKAGHVNQQNRRNKTAINQRPRINPSHQSIRGGCQLASLHLPRKTYGFWFDRCTHITRRGRCSRCNHHYPKIVRHHGLFPNPTCWTYGFVDAC